MEHGGEFVHEADAGGLRRGEAGHEAAEVDAGGEAEGGGDVLGELLGGEGAVGVEGEGRGRLVELGQADLVAQDVHVLAEGDVVHAVLLEGLEAGNLRDEVHDAVFAAHELAEAQGGVGRGEVLLAVGVGEGRRAALHRRAEDVDPGGEGHVEGGLGEGLVRVGDEAREVKFLDEGDDREEVLVPGDVREGVVEAADAALEEDEAEGGLEDLLVVLVLVEGVAEGRDGRVAVAHDVAVHLVALQARGRLVVLRRDGEAAVQVALVALQRGEDEVRADGAVLVGLEDREDGREHRLDEVVEQPLVALVELDGHLPRRRRRAVREVEEVDVERLLGQRLAPLRVHLFCPFAFRRELGQNGARRQRRRVGAEG